MYYYIDYSVLTDDMARAMWSGDAWLAGGAAGGSVYNVCGMVARDVVRYDLYHLLIILTGSDG